MNRTIRVTGKGSLSVKPDMIRLELDAKETLPEYADAYRRFTEDTDAIRKAVKTAGFDPQELKTTDFRIREDKKGYHDGNGNYKYRFLGYQYVHSMYIRFDNDPVLLNRILRSLTSCGVKIEFRINYIVKDAEAVKNELIAKAVADSEIKAKLLTRAAGVTLGDVLDIDYSWGQIRLTSSTTVREESDDLKSIFHIPSEKERSLDINADDLKVEDTVTVVWEIR